MSDFLQQLEDNGIIIRNKNKPGYYVNANHRYFTNERKALLEQIYEKTSLIQCDRHITLNERIYCIEHNILEVPKCVVCNQPVRAFRNGYSKVCSKKCLFAYEATLIDNDTGKTLKQLRHDKVREGNKKVGTDGLSSYQRGIRKTHYHLRNTIDEISGKTLAQLRTEKIIQSQKTILPNGLSIREQQHQNAHNTMSIIGEDGLSIYQKAKIKREQTLSERLDNGLTRKQAAIQKSIANKKHNYFNNNINNLSTDYDLVSDVDLYRTQTISIWKCPRCNNIFEHSFYNGQPPRCYDCYPVASSGTSYGETKIIEYIRSFYNGEILTNTRKIITPFELDIYIPDKNVAIEYNGTYWHSFPFTNPQYHKMKTDMCEEKGIQLLHIFENEWISKQNIICNIIRQKMIEPSYRLDGIVQEVSEDDALVFLENNHIQGSTHSSFRLGLYVEDRLVSLMTFDELFTQEWEIRRFCSLLDHNILGAAEKLFTLFVNKVNPPSVISYVDRRWGNDDTYLNLGFVFKHITNPDYWYVKNGIRYEQNTADTGYHQLYDSGKAVYVWKNINR